MAKITFGTSDGPIRVGLGEHEAVIEGSGAITYSSIYSAVSVLPRQRPKRAVYALMLLAKSATVISLIAMIALWIWTWVAGASVPDFVKVTANVVSFAFLGSILSFGGLKVFSLQLQSDASTKKIDAFAQQCPFSVVVRDRFEGIHQPGNPQFCVRCPLGIDTISDKDRGYLIHNCAIYGRLHAQWLDHDAAKEYVRKRYGPDEDQT